MDRKFTYVYLPVPDLAAARTFYRDQMGLDEMWREGETTCAFALPGSSIGLLLDQASAEDPETAGLVFTIPAVEQFYEEQQGHIAFLGGPRTIPGNGKWLRGKDVSGHGLYFADVE